MTIKYPVAHIAESISHVLAGRLIDYAEGRVKQSGHALLSDARVTVTRQGADPRYAVSWFDHRTGKTMGVECIIAHQERSFMDMGTYVKP